MTITEALSEVKLIQKRLERKRDFVKQFLWRQDIMRDPLAGNGGSVEVIQSTLQAIQDLGVRRIQIRSAIAAANRETMIEVEGVTYSIADWLTWRREVAPFERELLVGMRVSIEGARKQAGEKQIRVAALGEEPTERRDIRVNIDEVSLAKNLDRTETTLGRLDGLLQVANATTQIKLGPLEDKDVPTLEELNKIK